MEVSSGRVGRRDGACRSSGTDWVETTGVVGAEAGTLSFMVGGPEAA